MNKFIDSIIAFSLRRKYLILVVTLAVVVLGVLCFRDTPIDAFPDVTNTKVTIITQWQGRSAEEIEKFVNEDITNIFIDEIQFLKGNVKTLLKLSIMDDIDIYCAGLNMTSEQEPFGLMPQILAISDKIINTYSSCNVCGRKAIYTYYDGNKESEVLVGDEGYMSLCRRCLRRILIRKGDDRLSK